MNTIHILYEHIHRVVKHLLLTLAIFTQTLLMTAAGGAEKREVENFLEEIAMMKKVSSGECCHVVQMVGCVSTALPLALVLEFVPFGDLLSYLKYWKQKVKPS